MDVNAHDIILFSQQLFRKYRKYQLRKMQISITSLARLSCESIDTIVSNHLRQMFSGISSSKEICDVLMPWVKEIMIKEGFPVSQRKQAIITEIFEEASDLFRDLDTGMFNMTGYETHRMLEGMTTTSTCFNMLTRIHPDHQIDIALMVLEIAKDTAKTNRMKQIYPLDGWKFE